ncbi:tRNA lysidine(34) synthetase TilS [Kineococcus sp. T13]|uniref:tRNA lysidine(34) synthetase TilS n=1 Tax=Kineococcus vitellinus TaxID=2696565 RepID=UPI0014131FD4|nr:tRNA lysidine(34) synthetase TilS [Kineococcus vitellinus]
MSGPDPAVAAVRVAVRADLAAVAREHPGALVLVACSGGADSLALAAATAFEAPRARLRAGAVTVDHGLHERSADVAAGAAAACRALGLDPVRVHRVAVGRTGGPEAAARTARHEALERAAAATGAVAVLLAHTLDDQAETVLLGLARGSGTRSLAGMPAVRGHLRRPLLGLERATVRAACPPGAWEDPANADRRLARARVRHDVLPLLEERLGPGVARALARTARAARDDADALDALAAAGDPFEGGRAQVGALLAAPAALRRRWLRRAALAAGCPAGALGAGHVDALDALLLDWRGQGALALPGGASALRACGTLVLTPGPHGPAPLHP